MASRRNYWTCSKLADKIRGTNKIPSGTSEQWDDWHNAAKTAHRIRYWIAEEGLDHVQDFVNFIPDKLYDLKYYLVNRFVSKHHALTASPKSLKRGRWWDLDTRIVHCLFDELVNFVEVEKAHMLVAWSDEDAKKFKAPWYSLGRWKTRTWRSAPAGISYLQWEMSLKNNSDYGYKKGDKGYGKPTPQALAAKEIYEIYTWYKNVRPNRPDPMDASGWSAYCDEQREKNGDSLRYLTSKKTVKEQARVKKILNLTTKIEKQQYDEDTKMLNRLIAVRQNLWT
jgi:hypothetical protein